MREENKIEKRQQALAEGQIKRSLLTLFLIIASVFLFYLSMRFRTPLFAGVVLVFPVFAWLLGNPSYIFVMMLLLSYARFIIPGLPGGVSTEHLFMVMLIGWAIIYSALSKAKMKKPDLAGWCLILFFLTMLMIISVRGFGMGSLGGTLYGGKAYIYMAISILFYFSAPSITLSSRQIRVLFFGGALLAVIPFLVQLSIYMTGGASAGLTRFIDVSVSSIAESLRENDSTLMRWSSLNYLARGLLLIALVLPEVRRRKVLSWGLIAISMFLVALTGFRSSLIGMGVVIFVWLIYDSENRKRAFLSAVLLGVFGWLGTILFFPVLPGPVQRALSFLPLAAERVAYEAVLRGAEQSIDFRLEIWGYAWAHVSEYLLVGRGLAFDVTGWAWLQGWWYGKPEFFYASHAYHSGPLSLLIDWGVTGFLFGTAFMWFVCADAWRGVRRFCSSRQGLINRFYTFTTIQLSWICISFFLVYGEVRQTFPRIILLAVLLKVLQRRLIADEMHDLNSTQTLKSGLRQS